MPEPYRNIFISSVTTDHRDLRLQIAEQLRSPERNVLVQENLHGKGGSLIETLHDLVVKSDLVVHLIGLNSGYGPQELAVCELVDHLEESLPKRKRLSQRFPEVFRTLRDFPNTFSYTQWECWLAILHDIDCLVLRDQEVFPDGLSDLSRADARQRMHVQRLAEIGHDLVSEFGGLDSACNAVLKLETSILHRKDKAQQNSTSKYENREIIGRDDDRDSVIAALNTEAINTLVIAGAGGTGKTTLAKEVLKTVRKQGQVGYWVDLLRVADTNGIRSELLKAIYGLRFSERPANLQQKSLRERVGDAVAECRPSLIVLDNAEHVPDSAALVCQELLSIGASSMKVLITSQHWLQQLLPDASLFFIEALEIPNPEDPNSWCEESVRISESALLLRRRARGFLPPIDGSSWETIASICWQLKGVPLLLELAGGYLATKPGATIETLADRVARYGVLFEEPTRDSGAIAAIKDSEAKTQSIRASVKWSLEQCGGLDRDFLEKLAVLPDGFSIEFARKLWSSSEDALEFQIALLRRASLISTAESSVPRFRIVEAVRGYVLETIASYRYEALDHCCHTFIEYLRPYRRELVTEPSDQTVELLASERGNVLELVSRDVSKRNHSAVVELMALFMPILDRLGPAGLVVDRYNDVEHLLRRSGLPTRMRIARYFGRSSWAIGDWQRAQNECLELTSILATEPTEQALADDDRLDVILFLIESARLSTLGAADSQGFARAEEQLKLCDDHWFVLPSSEMLSLKEKIAIEAEMTIVKSRLWDRTNLFSEAMDLVKSFQKKPDNRKYVSAFRAARLHNEIGLCTWHMGSFDEAVSAFHSAASLFEDIHNWLWLGGVLTNLGFVQTDKGNYSKAAEYCERAHRLHRKVGNTAWGLTNMGAWGMALVFSDRIEEGIDRLNTALEGAATNDLGTAAQFRGDIARALLHQGDEQNLDIAIIHLEQAVATQAESNRASRRLFGNRVLLASVYQRQGRSKSEVTEAIRLAENDAKEIGLSPETPVLQVRRDFSLLRSVGDRRVKRTHFGAENGPTW